MTTPRTIDNLGPDASNQYARDKQLYEESLIQIPEALPGISAQATIDVTTPSFQSEHEMLFGLKEINVTVAKFSPPLQYNVQKGRIFTHQIAPSLGSEDQLEMQQQRIASSSTPASVANDREKREEELEKKILSSMVETVRKLDKDQVYINSHRDQYHKG